VNVEELLAQRAQLAQRLEALDQIAAGVAKLEALDRAQPAKPRIGEVRVCAAPDCTRAVPELGRGRRRYCSQGCKARAWQARQRAKENATPAPGPHDADTDVAPPCDNGGQRVAQGNGAGEAGADPFP
jgi:hypothetical protein